VAYCCARAGLICARVTSESLILTILIPNASVRDDGARLSIWNMDSPPVWQKAEETVFTNSSISKAHLILIQSQNYTFQSNHHDHLRPADIISLGPGL
jgi:hypothetical protein